MRADRLLSILLMLQVHGHLTARELAERLEVSERTIYRDMDALSASGVPIYTERGTGGGCFLPDDYRTDLTGLSEPEIQALFLATPARLLNDLGLQKADDTGQVKLIAALPPMFRRDAEYARQRIYVDVAGWNRRHDAVPFLQTIQEAVWQTRKLHLVYRRGDGVAVEREVDPLGLVAKGSVWYLVAAVEGVMRTYRVSRVDAARVLDTPCVRPHDFDLAHYWQQSSAAFKSALPRYETTLRIAPALLERLRLGGRYGHVVNEYPPDNDGWLVVDMLFELEDDACEYVLALGAQIEVLAPLALRERVIQAALGILATYGEQVAVGVVDEDTAFAV